MATTPNDPIKMYEDAIKAQKKHPSIEAVAKKEKPPQPTLEMPGELGNKVRRGIANGNTDIGLSNNVAKRAKEFVVSNEDVELGKKKMLEPEFSKAHDGRNI